MRTKYTDDDIENLHMLFHKMYGYINNEEQWNNFVQKFNEGKILH